jgi:hypothetical protein
VVNVSGILSLLRGKTTNPQTSSGLQLYWKLPVVEYVQRAEITKFFEDLCGKIFITTIVY